MPQLGLAEGLPGGDRGSEGLDEGVVVVEFGEVEHAAGDEVGDGFVRLVLGQDDVVRADPLEDLAVLAADGLGPYAGHGGVGEDGVGEVVAELLHTAGVGVDAENVPTAAHQLSGERAAEAARAHDGDALGLGGAFDVLAGAVSARACSAGC